MSYIDGFVAAVPAANEKAYREHVAEFAPIFAEFGAARIVECWGDDVPDGKVTDFRRAVKAKEDEVIAFSWIEYPSKAARDAAGEKMMTDPRMQEIGARMPFDGMRMIFGGFEVIHDAGAPNGLAYADGMILPVPTAERAAYIDFARKASEVMREHGATRIVDAWGDDVPDGKVTDYKGAVKAGGDETVVFSWIEWPSKEARDEGWRKMMEDPRMSPEAMPFDGSRWIYGGFRPIIDR